MLDAVIIWAVALLSVCGFALWKGDKLEQAGAVVILVGWLATIFAQQDTANFTPKYVWLAIDSTVLAIFSVMAWKSTRSWPLFAAAFQTISIAIHVSYLLDLKIGDTAYIVALAISGYGILGSLAAGAWRGWREREALDFAKR